MRDASTYRSERREAWRADERDISWGVFNMQFKGIYGVSPQKRSLYVGKAGRSKYMPHNGKREMARRRASLIIGAIVDIPKHPQQAA